MRSEEILSEELGVRSEELRWKNFLRKFFNYYSYLCEL